MAIMRNNIEIEGIGLKKDISKKSYAAYYIENHPIFIPRKAKIKNITKASIVINNENNIVVDTPLGKVLSVHAKKIITLIYKEKSHDKRQEINLRLPFVAYISLPEGVEDVSNIDISILDVFLDVIDSRKVYSKIFYFISFGKKETLENNIKENRSKENEEIKGQISIYDLEKSED